MLRSWGYATVVGGALLGGAYGTRSLRPAVVAQAAPTWSIDFNASGYNIERGECVSVKVGANAATECGDLRVTHELPAVRIFNTRLAPTLIYNSAHAHPVVSIPLVITLAATTDRPDSVEVIVRAGPAPSPTVIRRTQRWAGSDWPAGSTVTRRVTATWDAVDDTTGLYFYTVEVTNIYPGNVRVPNAVVGGGSTPVVNRKGSPFGAGWWLAGLEQLKPTRPAGTTPQYLWVGGDGSARVFMPPYALAYDRLDSLTWNAGTQVWTRRLPEGRRVEFNATGQHLRTVNRFGRTTTYAYSSTALHATLTSLTLPAPSGMAYFFAYGNPNTRLSAVTAPPLPGVPRTTQVTITSDTVLTAITNPGDAPVQFTYTPNGPLRFLLTQRIDRRNVGTVFTYDSAFSLRTSTVNPGGGAAPIVWTIRAGESRGLPRDGTPAAVDTLQTGTRIDGPRTDVSDTTTIFQERYGSPRRIVDATGATTHLRRRYLQTWYGYDEGWVLYRLVRPLGFTLDYAYEYPRGNVVTVTDPVGSTSAGPDVTRFAWDQTFDQLRLIVPPEKDSTIYSINPANGRREWEQSSRGDSSRVTYAYGNGTFPELPTQVILPPAATGGTAATYRIGYSSIGNTTGDSTPRLFATLYTQDAIGRTLRVVAVVDSLPGSPRRKVQGLAWNLRDEVTIDSSTTDNLSDVVLARTYYDAEGQVDSVVRSMSPDPAGIGAMKTSWLRDQVGRVVKAIAPDGKFDSTVYDPAGNATRTFNRRFNPLTVDSTQYVSATYDPLNRVLQRTIRGVQYASASVGIATQLNQAPYPALSVPDDIQNFTYTLDGQLKSARNRYAEVGRGYSSRGDLTVDTLRIADVGVTTFAQHVYVTEHRYDRNGRRTVLRLPPPLVTAGKDSIRYVYAPWGALQRVVAPYQDSVLFTYTWRNETRQLSYPVANLTRAFGFDADGNLTGDTIANPSTAFPRFAFPQLRAAKRVYDGRGKVLKSTNLVAYPETWTSGYSAMGYLTTSAFRQDGAAGWPAGALYGTGQTYTLDPLGNVTGRLSADTVSTGGIVRITSASSSAAFQRKTGRDSLGTSTSWTDSTLFDAAGNQRRWTRVPYLAGAQSFYQDRVSYYDAAGRLVFADARLTNAVLPVGARARTRTQETARYDALGRRVVLRAVQDCALVDEEAPLFISGAASVRCSMDLLRRTVWDGDRELVEIQAPGDTTAAEQPFLEQDVGPFQRAKTSAGANDPNPYYGRVLYTHGPGLDEPLSVTRLDYADWPVNGAWTPWAPYTVHPFWDPTTGRPLAGAYSDGAAVRPLVPNAGPCAAAYQNSPSRCVLLDWPMTWTAYDPRQDVPMRSWQGSLVEQKRDYAGTFYRRQRSYDPKSGRFTQEDPIGLAGGLNLYGYAGGDPINFSDPFGLCPNKEDPRCSIGQQIRAGIEATFDRFLDGVGALGQALRGAMPGLAREAAVEAALAALPVVGEIRGARRVVAVVEATGQFLTENRHVRGVNAARKDFARIGVSADEVGAAIGRSSGWEAVSQGALAGGQVRIGRGTVRYTLQNLGKETVFNAWIP